MWSDRQRGAALFVVLAFAALLASLVGAAMRTGVSGARAAAVFAETERADELGRGAGDVVAAQLASTDPDVLRGGRLLVRLSDADVTVDYVSESARIDVNTAPVPLITALLATAGADQPVVDAAAGRIAQLRKQSGVKPEVAGGSPGQVTSMPNLVASTEATGPPAIQSTLDLARAWGVPEDLARRVLPAVTTRSGSSRVDPVIAGRQVLLALMGGDDTRTDDYMERRMQGFVNTDSALVLLPVTSRAFASFSDVAVVRATARVVIAKRFERRYEMIVSSAPGQGAAVVSWRKLQ